MNDTINNHATINELPFLEAADTATSAVFVVLHIAYPQLEDLSSWELLSADIDPALSAAYDILDAATQLHEAIYHYYETPSHSSN